MTEDGDEAPLGRVYAIAGAKGGVGKTTTALNLAALFAAGDRDTVVVDDDLVSASLTGYLDFTPDGATLHDVLADEADLADAVHEDVSGGFDLVPGATSLEAFAAVRGERLREVVEALREQYDVVVVDVGAGLSQDTVTPLGLADRVLLVTTQSEPAVDAAEKTKQVTERLDGSVEGVVVTRANKVDRVREIAKRLDVPLLAAVPSDPAIAKSEAEGAPLVVIDRDTPAAKAYMRLAGKKETAAGGKEAATGEN